MKIEKIRTLSAVVIIILIAITEISLPEKTVHNLILAPIFVIIFIGVPLVGIIHVLLIKEKTSETKQ